MNFSTGAVIDAAAAQRLAFVAESVGFAYDAGRATFHRTCASRADRISCSSRGGEEPTVCGGGESALAANRHDEFVLMNELASR